MQTDKCLFLFILFIYFLFFFIRNETCMNKKEYMLQNGEEIHEKGKQH